MRPILITIHNEAGLPVDLPLHPDATGWSAYTNDGLRISVTATPTSPPATTPAKARMAAVGDADYVPGYPDR